MLKTEMDVARLVLSKLDSHALLLQRLNQFVQPHAEIQCEQVLKSVMMEVMMVLAVLQDVLDGQQVILAQEEHLQ